VNSVKEWKESESSTPLRCFSMQPHYPAITETISQSSEPL
jgi:hypothetical protein